MIQKKRVFCLLKSIGVSLAIQLRYNTGGFVR